MTSSSSTSAVLMKIVRDMALNRDDLECREHHKHFVEQQFKSCDVRIDRVVSESSSELTRLIQLFGEIMKRIETSKSNVSQCLELVRTCKNLLLLKRSEIRRLWMHSIEQNVLVDMYNRIHEIRSIPERLTFYRERGLYVHAASLLVNALGVSVFGPTDEIDPIGLKRSVLGQRHELVTNLMTELDNVIFVTNDAPSSRITNGSTSANSNNEKRKNMIPPSAGRLSFEDATLDNKWVWAESTDSKLAVLIESAKKLEAENDMVNHLKVNLHNKLESLADRETQLLLDRETPGQHLLSPLLVKVFSCFDDVASRCRIFKSILPNNTSKSVNFDMLFIWISIQKILSSILLSHLISTDTQQISVPEETICDLDPFFLNSPNRPFAIRESRFRFSQSAHVQSIAEYYRECGNAIKSGKPHHLLVCAASYKNIRSVYSSLDEVMRKIEERLKRDCPNNAQFLLKEAVSNFVRDTFVVQLRSDLRQNIQENLPASSRSTELIPVSLQRQCKMSVPVLFVSYLSFRGLEKLVALIEDMPTYTNDFVIAMNELTLQHRMLCLTAVSSVLDSVILLSAEWVRDPDINRHLRSMPACDLFLRRKNANTVSSRYLTLKETETLLLNLTKEEVTDSQRLITDYRQLRMLAHHQESLSWFSDQAAQFLDKLNNSAVAPETKETFTAGLSGTDTLAANIILLLFLEVRVHCFFHLLQMSKPLNVARYASAVFDETEGCEPDHNITLLNRDLTRIYESFRNAITQQKLDFLFGGLGFLIATVLIGFIANFSQLSENGLTRMCRNVLSIHDTLGALQTTSGDATQLLRALNFYELFRLSIDEILTYVNEDPGGASVEYREQDYKNLIALKYRTNPEFDLEDVTSRLNDVLESRNKNQFS